MPTREPEPEYRLDGDDEDYVPYVPVQQRRQQKLAKFVSSTSSAGTKRKLEEATAQDEQDVVDEEEARRERVRKERTLLVEAQEVHQRKAIQGACALSGLDDLLTSLDAQKTDHEKKDEQEAEILAAIANRRQLASDRELAQGIKYTDPLKTS